MIDYQTFHQLRQLHDQEHLSDKVSNSSFATRSAEGG